MFKWIKKRFTPQKTYVLSTLRECQGDQMEAARRLRMTVQELSERVERMRQQREQTNQQADASHNV